jgi:hypothetical protein
VLAMGAAGVRDVTPVPSRAPGNAVRK